MSNDVDNILPEPLSAIRAWHKSADQNVADIKMCPGVIDHHATAINVSDVQRRSETDRINTRLDLIEKRLELRDS